jgi:hypothetical protein
MNPDNATVTLNVYGAGEPYGFPGSIDVVFCMDVSGTPSYISYMQASFNDMANTIKSWMPTARFGIVSFRDHDDSGTGGHRGSPGDWPYKKECDLTGNNTIALLAINKITGGGGADEPASYDVATFNTTHDFAWRTDPNVTRMIIVIGASYPHDKRYGAEDPAGSNYSTPLTYIPHLRWVDPCIGGYNVGEEALAHNITVSTITTGWGASSPTSIQAQMDIASYTGGIHLNASSSGIVPYLAVSIIKIKKMTLNTAAIQPSPTEYMITDVLPPYIEYQGTWKLTPNNNATIKGFSYIRGLGDLWELRWDVPKMKVWDCFEVQYDIKSNLSGWQSIGVTSYNATAIYGSDYCKVKYQNWRFMQTGDPKDIWTNETPDISIFVKDSTVPDLPIIIVPAITMMAIFIIIRRKR